MGTLCPVRWRRPVVVQVYARRTRREIGVLRSVSVARPCVSARMEAGCHECGHGQENWFEPARPVDVFALALCPAASPPSPVRRPGCQIDDATRADPADHSGSGSRPRPGRRRGQRRSRPDAVPERGRSLVGGRPPRVPAGSSASTGTDRGSLRFLEWLVSGMVAGLADEVVAGPGLRVGAAAEQGRPEATR